MTMAEPAVAVETGSSTCHVVHEDAVGEVPLTRDKAQELLASGSFFWLDLHQPTKEDFAVTSAGSTHSWSTMICFTLSSTPGIRAFPSECVKPASVIARKMPCKGRSSRHGLDAITSDCGRPSRATSRAPVNPAFAHIFSSSAKV